MQRCASSIVRLIWVNYRIWLALIHLEHIEGFTPVTRATCLEEFGERLGELAMTVLAEVIEQMAPAGEFFVACQAGGPWGWGVGGP